ncbi:MAG TPA: PhoH family protein [bacterium]|nr:PhoH family protein [bacterium]
MAQKKISIRGVEQPVFLGVGDRHLRLIESAFEGRLVVRGDELTVIGAADRIPLIEKVITEIRLLIARSGTLAPRDVETVIDLVKLEGDVALPEREMQARQEIILYAKKGLVRPKTSGQEAYYRAVLKNDIVFCIGPAGTGKTYLAVAMAVAFLREKEISKIVLARPAIEAGESLGFLPGDLMEKVDPYLRPLTDALFDMLPADQLQKYMERRIIEIVPLAYMRGRTLNNAFVILDEAQNTTPMQMKMFLTRLGLHSKAIATGDITQVDLANGTPSGLIQIQEILTGIAGIDFVYLDRDDVVRHRLVKDIIEAYEAFHQPSEEEGETAT